MGESVYRTGQGMDLLVVREEDTVYCNLNAENIIAELDRTFNQLRLKLTVDGRRAQVDGNHPFVRLIIRYTHDDQQFSTALLILRGDCYSYSFFANGRWVNVSDSKYKLEDHDGREIAKDMSIDSDYSMFDFKTAGLSNLARAVMCLHGNNHRIWRPWYKHIVFVFIESARLSPIAAYFLRVYTFHVDACIEGCDHTEQDLSQLSRHTAIHAMCDLCREGLFDLLQSPVYPIDALPYDFRDNWGNLSDALTDEGPGWSLNQRIAALLELPTGEGHEEQQRTMVTEFVRIVKPPRLRP